MEANVTLQLDGNRLREVAVRSVLRGMRQRGQDFRSCFDEALNLIFAHEAQLFRQTGETLDEPRWADLSPVYEAWKDKTFPGRGILELRGKLMRQLTGEGGHYEKRERTKLVMGSNYPIKWRGGTDDLGGLHMSGRPGHGGRTHIAEDGRAWTMNPNPPMPARPPIRTSPALANELLDIFVDYWTDGRRA